MESVGKYVLKHAQEFYVQHVKAYISKRVVFVL